MTNEQSQTNTSPFLVYLRTNLPALVELISQQLHKEQVGPYKHVPLDQARGLVAASVEPYFQALAQQSETPLAQRLHHVLQPSLIQQTSIESLLRITAIYRANALDLAMRAIAEGIADAIDGAKQLIKLFDLATDTIGRSYQRQLSLFQTLAEYAPDGIGVASLDGLITYANPTMRDQVGYGDDLIGTPITTIIAPEEHAKLAELRGMLTQGKSWRGNLRYQRKDHSQFIGNVSSYSLRDDNGNQLANVAIVRDITTQLEAESDRQQLQQQVIDAQQAALAELSTPLIPISDDVMVMPLIGMIDSARAGQLVERLLEGVVGSHANTAIIDITGVPVVDTQVAQTLLRAAQAASLVGARVILTGIRPEVAQTLVGLGVDMGGIITRSTLQSGITYALESGRSAKR